MAITSGSLSDAIKMADYSFNSVEKLWEQQEPGELKVELNKIASYLGTALDVLREINDVGVFVPDKNKKSEALQEAKTGVDIAVDTIMSLHKDGDDNTLDEKWLNDDIQLTIQNTQQLADGVYNTRRPAHSVAYQGLLQALNNRSETPLTGNQIQSAFKKLGLDFKQVIKPTVDWVEQERKDEKEESKTLNEDIDTEEYSYGFDYTVDKQNPIWIVGDVNVNDNVYRVNAKVFLEDSEFGIDKGPISKLTIFDKVTNENIVNYDRGWDLKPQTDMDKKVYDYTIKTLLDFRKENPYKVEESQNLTEDIQVQSSNKIINPQDSDYYENDYIVSVYPKDSEDATPYTIFANDEQQALALLCTYLEQQCPECLVGCEDVVPEDTDLIYVDGTEYGATKPYYMNIQESKSLNEAEDDIDTDEIEQQEYGENLLDDLQNRIGQKLSIGEFNTMLQSLFAKYNTIFLTYDTVYDIQDWDEPQELTVMDDDDIYVITYKVDMGDIENPLIEMTDVELE